MKKIIFFSIFFLFLGLALTASAYQPRIIYYQQGDVLINNPEVSQFFYDELKGQARGYIIDSDKAFKLHLNILVPELENRNGKYSAKVFLLKRFLPELGQYEAKEIIFLDGSSTNWEQFYEESNRDYYLKGPEINQELAAGKYKIEIFSKNLGDQTENQGKYVLSIGQKEIYDIQSLLNLYWQLPLLKVTFFKTSPLQFFLTPFGIIGIGVIGFVLIFLAIFYYLVGVIKESIKHKKAKTLFLTSGGMRMKDEMIKLLQKPAYDITVAFITTAAKPQENLDYVKRDLSIMRDEMGFNVEEIDIEGKSEPEVMNLLKLKDIIFVEGGNTFYLLKAMKACNFGKIVKKLLKQGKVYVGASAGSIVAGRTIKTANWKGGDKNIVGLRNLKGLNLVPFDIFVHYQPEHAQIIQQQIKNPKKRKKRLRILTDDQAILVQGKDIMLIGKGEKIIV